MNGVDCLIYGYTGIYIASVCWQISLLLLLLTIDHWINMLFYMVYASHYMIGYRRPLWTRGGFFLFAWWICIHLASWAHYTARTQSRLVRSVLSSFFFYSLFSLILFPPSAVFNFFFIYFLFHNFLVFNFSYAYWVWVWHEFIFLQHKLVY